VINLWPDEAGWPQDIGGAVPARGDLVDTGQFLLEVVRTSEDPLGDGPCQQADRAVNHQEGAAPIHIIAFMASCWAVIRAPGWALGFRISGSVGTRDSRGLSRAVSPVDGGPPEARRTSIWLDARHWRDWPPLHPSPQWAPPDDGRLLQHDLAHRMCRAVTHPHDAAGDSRPPTRTG